MGKDVTFANVSRSLNRLEGFIYDMLPTIQSYCEGRIDVEESMSRFTEDVKWNREGDESIGYLGIHDCVDFILNSQSILLAKRAFSIESKVREIESVLLSYLNENMIKPTSDLLWQTGRILWQIGELHIEPFIQESGDAEVSSETTNGLSSRDNIETNDKPLTIHEPNQETPKPDNLSSADDISNKKRVLSAGEINAKLKDIETFEQAKENEIISFGNYYQKLTDGKVIDKDKYDFDLFESCVKRAYISGIVTEGNKSIARLFMYYVASKFKDSNGFRKAAARSFGLNPEKTRLSAVDAKYRADFLLLLGKEFPDSKPKK